jgi:hypothetical protein
VIFSDDLRLNVPQSPLHLDQLLHSPNGCTWASTSGRATRPTTSRSRRTRRPEPHSFLSVPTFRSASVISRSDFTRSFWTAARSTTTASRSAAGWKTATICCSSMAAWARTIF